MTDGMKLPESRRRRIKHGAERHSLGERGLERFHVFRVHCPHAHLLDCVCQDAWMLHGVTIDCRQGFRVVGSVAPIG